MSERHVTWNRLLEARSDGATLSPAEHRHVGSCEACAGLAAEIHALVGTLEAASVPEVSPTLVRRTLDRIAEIRTRRESAAGGTDLRELAAAALDSVRRITAELVADSRFAPAGSRGSVGLSPRLMVFEAAGYSVSVSCEKEDAAERFALRGQVMPRERDDLPPGGTVQIESDTGTEHRELSPMGRFDLTDLVSGDVAIEIDVGGERIQLGPIRIGDALE